MESKEYLGGLWIIEAADLDVVLKLAAEGLKACNRKVEVRPFALDDHRDRDDRPVAEIRTLLNDRAAAITAKDARRAVAHLAPEVVSFGLAPPLRDAGDEARDPAGIEGWFGTWDGPIGYDIGDLVIEAGDDVAFCHGLTHMTGTKTMGSRLTCGSGPPSGSAGRPWAGRSPTSMTPRRSTWTARAGPPPT